MRTEDRRKIGRLKLSHHHVGIRDGERSAAPITGGPRTRAGAGGADPIPATVELENGAAAGSDGVDCHDRHAHRYASHLSVEGTFELTGIQRYVRRSAPHVETDDSMETRSFCGAHGPHDPTGGSREDCVLALKSSRVRQTAVGLHQVQRCPA